MDSPKGLGLGFFYVLDSETQLEKYAELALRLEFNTGGLRLGLEPTKGGFHPSKEITDYSF